VRDEQVKLLISLIISLSVLMQQAISPPPRPTHPTMSGERNNFCADSQLRATSDESFKKILMNRANPKYLEFFQN